MGKGKGKGKAKETGPMDLYMTDSMDEQEEEGQGEDLGQDVEMAEPTAESRRKDKGKKKMVSEEDKEWRKEAAEKRHTPQSTGHQKVPACVRCINAGRVCYEQVVSSLACVACAKMKLRCQQPGTGGDVAAEQVPPQKKPAQKKKSAAPKQRKTTTNPTPPKNRRVIKSAPMVDEDSDVSAPAEAFPSAHMKSRKTNKSPAIVEQDSVSSGPDMSGPAAIPSAHTSKKRKTIKSPAMVEQDSDSSGPDIRPPKRSSTSAGAGSSRQGIRTARKTSGTTSADPGTSRKEKSRASPVNKDVECSEDDRQPSHSDRLDYMEGKYFFVLDLFN
jgi:hypothetical protein